MIGHHAEDGQGTEAVDIGTIRAMREAGLVGAHADYSRKTRDLQGEKRAVLQLKHGASESQKEFLNHVISRCLCPVENAAWLAGGWDLWLCQAASDKQGRLLSHK